MVSWEMAQPATETLLSRSVPVQRKLPQVSGTVSLSRPAVSFGEWEIVIEASSGLFPKHLKRRNLNPIQATAMMKMAKIRVMVKVSPETETVSRGMEKANPEMVKAMMEKHQSRLSFLQIPIRYGWITA